MAKKKIQVWAIIDKEGNFFMPFWNPPYDVFSHMIFSSKDSAKKVMKIAAYKKMGKIVKIEIKIL